MVGMMCARLKGFNKHQFLTAEFRKHQPTKQQVLMHSLEIKTTLDKKETVLSLFVDFKGA